MSEGEWSFEIADESGVSCEQQHLPNNPPPAPLSQQGDVSCGLSPSLWQQVSFELAFWAARHSGQATSSWEEARDEQEEDADASAARLAQQHGVTASIGPAIINSARIVPTIRRTEWILK